MTCKANKCEAAAVVTVYWPGQTTEQCAAHALRAQNIASAMGFTVRLEPLAPEAYEAPTVTPLGQPDEMRTTDLMRCTAALVEAFTWGAPVARALRLRAARMDGGFVEEVVRMFVDPLPHPLIQPEASK